jgi:hypothetical protein
VLQLAAAGCEVSTVAANAAPPIMTASAAATNKVFILNSSPRA